MLTAFLCPLCVCAQTHIYVLPHKILSSLNATISFNFSCPYRQAQCFAHRICSKNICWLIMSYKVLYDFVLLPFSDSSFPLPDLLFTVHFYCSIHSSPKCSRFYVLPGLCTHWFPLNQLKCPVHLVWPPGWLAAPPGASSGCHSVPLITLCAVSSARVWALWGLEI